MKKNILLILSLILLAGLLIYGVDIQSVDEYYDTHPDEVTAGGKSVTFSIDCSTIYDHYDDLDESLKQGRYLPEDGIILPETEIMLQEGDTVLDILKRAAQLYRIPMEYQGTEQNAYGSAYVQGIQYLYEFSCGPMSGWMFTVNKEVCSVGCTQKKPQDGDVIAFVYTCELGKDLGFDDTGASGLKKEETQQVTPQSGGTP